MSELRSYRIERDGFHFHIDGHPEQIVSLKEHDQQIRAQVLEDVYKRLKEEMQECSGCYYIPLIELKELFAELKGERK